LEYTFAFPDHWLGNLDIFWDAGKPLFPRDFDRTSALFSGRWHLWQRQLMPPKFVFWPRIDKEEFPELLQPSTATPESKHGVVTHILMDGGPAFAKACRLDLAKCRMAEEEFTALERAGTVPNLTNLSANMDGCPTFSKLNLFKAFLQVPLPLRTSRRWLPSPSLDCLSINTCNLASVMLARHSRGCKTVCFVIFCIFLCI
jgi:hypothetical protein